MKDDDVMEELYRVKAEIASKFSTFRDFAQDLLKRQTEAHPEWALPPSVPPAL